MSTRAIRHSTHDEQAGMMLQHQPQHLYASNASPGGYGSPQHYGQLFPLGGPGGPMNMGPPPGPIPPLPPRFEPQYDPALYQHQYPPNIIRQPPVPGPGNRNDGGNVSEHREGQPLNGSQRERGGGEMFAAFLEADERSRQMAAAAAAAAAQRQHQDQLNWPSSTPSPSTPTTPPTIQPNQPGASSNATTAPPNTENWFDIFSGGSGPAPNPAPAEGPQIAWPRITNVENINAHIARILNDPAAPPSPQRPGGSVVTPPDAAGSGNIAMGSGTAGNGDSVNTKAESAVAPVAQSREEAADETEAEKDAEGEDEDVDGGGGNDKKEDTSMVVDPPQSSTKEGAKEVDMEEENHVDEIEQGDGGDGGTVKAKTKPSRGRPKKSTTGSRGKAKAKG